ncbi:ABC transporter permease, partial [Achromobacter xylosoxidans]
MTRRAWLSPGLLLAAPVLFFAAFFLAPLAVARYEFPGKAALTSVLMSPLVLPHIVLGDALLQ